MTRTRELARLFRALDTADEARAALPEVIAAAIRESRWTWRGLAQELGVAVNTLQQWTDGRAAPTSDNRRRLLEILRRR